MPIISLNSRRNDGRIAISATVEPVEGLGACVIVRRQLQRAGKLVDLRRPFVIPLGEADETVAAINRAVDCALNELAPND